MSATIAAIWRYPVKGLTGESLDAVTLTAGEALPFDRRYGIVQGSAQLDPGRTIGGQKHLYLTLMTLERLAALDARFDPATATLTISRHGRQVARGELGTPHGRAVIGQFLAAYLGDKARGLPRVVEATDDTMADRPGRFVSVINRASAQDLERVVGAAVDPRRFRGNFLIDGLAPWAEREWVGRRVRLGQAQLEIVERIGRCAATNVNPTTAERDLNIPKALLSGYGRDDCGVLGRVVEGGRVAVGDAIAVA